MQVFHNKLTQSCHLLWKETLSLFCPDKIKIMNNKQICSLLQRLAFHKKAMTASALEMCRSIGVPLGGNWPPVALNTGEEAWCFMATIGTEDQTAQHLLLLLLRRFSHVRLCATPETAAHQAPPSLGFSRQGHWSGLPFPSPLRENEKWKWSRSVASDS